MIAGLGLGDAFGQGGVIVIGPPGWGTPCQPPLNDHHSLATLLEGTFVTVSGTNTCASVEPGEPDHAGTAPFRSVWYRWTAPTTGPVALVTAPVMRVDVRELAALPAVASVIDAQGRRVFEAVGGRTYLIVVDNPPSQSFFSLPGHVFDLTLEHFGLRASMPIDARLTLGDTLTLEIEPTDPEETVSDLRVWANEVSIGERAAPPFRLDWVPTHAGRFQLIAEARLGSGRIVRMDPFTVTFREPNDDFAQAISVPGNVVRQSFGYHTAGAGVEAGEPLTSVATNSLWWKWTPTYQAVTRIDSQQGHLFVYRGTSLDDLELVAHSTPNRLVITAWGSANLGGASFVGETGVTYWFAAVAADPDWANAWSITRTPHWFEGETEGHVGRPLSGRLGKPDEAPSPASVQITVERPRQQWTTPPPGGIPTSVTMWDFVFAATPSGPSFEWEWQPTEPGPFRVRYDVSYHGAGVIAGQRDLLIRPANDLFDFADVIPAAADELRLPFRSDLTLVETDEPMSWTNSPQRSVWWRWTPEENVHVRFHADCGFGGLPLDIFQGADLGSLTRVAHNDSRTLFPPLLGYVLLEATAGQTYHIRVCDPRPDTSSSNPLNPLVFGPTVRTNLSLVMEAADAPVPGLLVLSTAMGTLDEDGSIAWEVFAKVRQQGGVLLATNFNHRAQFYVGSDLAALRPVSVPGHTPIRAWAPEGEAELIGTATFGLWAVTNVTAGDDVFVQLRAWDGLAGASYEAARTNGGTTGRSVILRVRAGSELMGPALLDGLNDVVLGEPVIGFHTGQLTPAGIEAGASVWRLTASPGHIHVVEAGELGTGWTPLLLLTNTTGSVTFTDPRTERGPVVLYRARVVD